MKNKRYTGQFMIRQIAGILILIQIILSQQVQEGTPYSRLNGLDNTYHSINLPLVDWEAMLEEDSVKPQGTPYRYGFKHEVNYSPENSGIWEETTDGGLLWQISFKSEDAFALSFEYDEFFIPEGGELYIMTPDYEMVQGAYTHLNNSNTRRFATPHLKGDTALIEYYQPPYTQGKFSLIITEIIHDYRDIMDFSSNGRDWECGVNVICETDETYQGAINSVAFLDMGAYICSGAMVNNVRQDLMPYSYRLALCRW